MLYAYGQTDGMQTDGEDLTVTQQGRELGWCEEEKIKRGRDK